MQPRISTSLAVGLCLGTLCSLAALPASSQVPPAAGNFIIHYGASRCAQSALEGGVFGSAPQGRDQNREKLDAPYSGVGVTEVINVLADGNRITRKNTMRYFRDSRGRTRTEFELIALGPLTLDGKRTAVTISDPVANARYMLHADEKRAIVMDASNDGPTFAIAGAPIGPPTGVQGGIVTRRLADAPPPGAHGGGNVIMLRERLVTAPGKIDCDAQSKATPVSLGERTLEGFKTRGSRLEVVIPAGEIGNELPMTITTEQWFSPDLGVVIASTHHDPMSGDTTYKLTQIARAEPDPALFTVPADYTRVQVQGPQKLDLKTTPPASRRREQ